MAISLSESYRTKRKTKSTATKDKADKKSGTTLSETYRAKKSGKDTRSPVQKKQGTVKTNDFDLTKEITTPKLNVGKSLLLSGTTDRTPIAKNQADLTNSLISVSETGKMPTRIAKQPLITKDLSTKLSDSYKKNFTDTTKEVPISPTPSAFRTGTEATGLEKGLYSAGKGLVRASGDVATAFGTVTQYMSELGDRLAGRKTSEKNVIAEYFNKINDTADTVYNSMDMATDRGTGKVGEFVNGAIENFTYLIPTIASSLMLGGSSAATGAMTLNTTAKTGIQYASKMLQSLKGMTTFMTQAAGGYAQDSIDKGDNITTQVLKQTYGGLLEGITETIPFGYLEKLLGISGTKEMAKQGVRQIISKYGKNALSNIITNVVQEIVVDPLAKFGSNMIGGGKSKAFGEGGYIDLKVAEQSALGALGLSLITIGLGLPVADVYHAAKAESFDKALTNLKESLKTEEGQAILKAQPALGKELAKMGLTEQVQEEEIPVQAVENAPVTSQDTITATETPEQGNVSRETVEKKATAVDKNKIYGERKGSAQSDNNSPLLDEYNYYEDEASETWVNDVSKKAIANIKAGNFRSDTRATFINKPTADLYNVFLDPKYIKETTQGGLNNEKGNENTIRELTKSMKEKGYDLRKAKSTGTILERLHIYVDATGKAYVAEGNNRLQAAINAGLDSVPVRISYYDGAERIGTEWKPDNIVQQAQEQIRTKKSPTVSKTEMVAEAKTPETTDTDFIEKSIPLVQKNADQLSEYADMLKKNPTMFGGLVQPDSKLGKAFSDFLDVKIKKYKRMLEQMKSKKMTQAAINEVQKLIKIKESIPDIKEDMRAEFKKELEAIEYTNEQDTQKALEKLSAKFYAKIDKLNDFIESEKYKAFWKDALAKQDLKEQAKLFRQEIKDKVEETKQKIRERIAEAKERKAERESLAKKQTKFFNTLKKLTDLYPEFEKMANEIKAMFDLEAKTMTLRKRVSLEKSKAYFDRVLQEMEDEGADQESMEYIIPKQLRKGLNRLDKAEIGYLTEEQVDILQEAVDNILKQNELKGMLIGKQHLKDIKEVLTDALKGINAKDVDSLRIKHDLEKLLHFAMDIDALNPETLALRMIGWDENNLFYKYMYDNMVDGQRAMNDFEREAANLLEEAIDTLDISDVQNDIKLADNTVRLNGWEKISLYMHATNEENIAHLIDEKGGGRVKYTDEKGRARVRTKNTRFTEADMVAIRKSLTADEMKFVKLLRTYFDVLCKDAINKTSVILNGFELAKVKKYFPIVTDNWFQDKDFPALYRKLLLTGQGFLQARIGGKNPIVIEDVRDVIQRTTKAVGSYAGFAVPVRDAKMIIGNQQVKNAITIKYGKQALDYWDKLFEQIERNKEEYDIIEKNMMNIVANMQKAVFGLNPWIIMKQPISFLSAQAELNVRDLRLSELTKKDWETIYKYSSYIWKRSKGFITKESGELTTRLQHLHRKLDWTTAPITLVDRTTIGAIWKQVETEIKRTHPSLEVGSDEFYEAVARRTEQVIFRTQANYGVMQRSAVGRSQVVATKLLTMFTSESNAQYNMLYKAIMTAGKNPAKAAKTVFYVALAQFAVALVNLARDRWRKKDEKNMYQYALESAAGLVYFAGDLLSDYGLSGNTAVDVVNEALQIFKNPSNSLSDIGWLKKAAGAIGQLTGIPINNITKEIEAGLAKFAPEWYEMWQEAQSVSGVMLTFNSKKNELTKRQREYDIAREYENLQDSAYYTDEEKKRMKEVYRSEYKAVAGNDIDDINLDTIETEWSQEDKKRYVAGYKAMRKAYNKIQDIKDEIKKIEENFKMTEAEKKKAIAELKKEYEAIAETALGRD